MAGLLSLGASADCSRGMCIKHLVSYMQAFGLSVLLPVEAATT